MNNKISILNSFGNVLLVVIVLMLITTITTTGVFKLIIENYSISMNYETDSKTFLNAENVLTQCVNNFYTDNAAFIIITDENITGTGDVMGNWISFRDSGFIKKYNQNTISGECAVERIEYGIVGDTNIVTANFRIIALGWMQTRNGNFNKTSLNKAVWLQRTVQMPRDSNVFSRDWNRLIFKAE